MNRCHNLLEGETIAGYVYSPAHTAIRFDGRVNMVQSKRLSVARNFAGLRNHSNNQGSTHEPPSLRLPLWTPVAVVGRSLGFDEAAKHAMLEDPCELEIYPFEARFNAIPSRSAPHPPTAVLGKYRDLSGDELVGIKSDSSKEARSLILGFVFTHFSFGIQGGSSDIEF
jgi:hypothetical protein